MKFSGQIAAVLLALVVLVETIGVQVIRDICLPCDYETISVQLALDDYDSKTCHEQQAVAHHHDTGDSCCCSPVSCTDGVHQHQKDVQVVANYPDFFEPASNILFSAPAIVLAALVESQEALYAVERAQQPLFQSGLKPVNPNSDRQSLLCSYLI